jgi:hypothetical protein
MSEWKNRITGYADVNPKELMPNPKNWRTHPGHQANALKGVMNEVGVVQNVLVNQRTGMLVDGHLRVALAIKERQTTIPVTYVDLDEAEEALILATLDPIAAQAGVDKKRLAETLAAVTTDDVAVAQLIKNLAAAEKLHWDNNNGMVTPLVPTPKQLPQYYDPRVIDCIFTWTENADGFINIAVKGGLQYGVRSTENVSQSYSPVFIDNKWENYNHEHHLSVVAQYKPKYATCLDLLTEAQCAALNLPYIDFDTIMGYAEQLSNYAENVILIPKYDCIDDIPEKYMLGYSIPSTYGGTPLPFQRFIGKRVHLLGGSPRKQWEFYTMAPETIVSVDTNYICKISKYGAIADYSHMAADWGVQPELLKARQLKTFVPAPVTNPLYIAFAINVGYYATMWKRVGAVPVEGGNVQDVDPEMVYDDTPLFTAPMPPYKRHGQA